MDYIERIYLETRKRGNQTVNAKWYQKKWFLVLMCVLFPYIGIFLIWNRTQSKALKALVSVWAVIALVAIFSDDDKTKQATAPSTNQSQSVDPVVKTEQDKKKAEAEAKAKAEAEAKAKAEAEAKKPENVARVAVHKAFGETNSFDKKDSILEMNFNKDNGFLLIKVFAKDNLTEKFIKLGMWDGMTQVLKELKDNQDMKTVSFMIIFPMQDAYGKSSNDTVMKAEFNAEIRAKINFENFISKNIPVIAQNYWEHPAIRKIQVN